MSRIIIEIPESFSFAKNIELTDSHMNIGNHLDNVLLLTLVGDTRAAFWQHLGYSPFDLEGVSNIIADAALQYKSEAFKGEIMVVEQAIADFHKYGFNIIWRISDKATGREVARGKHGLLCFNYAEKTIALLPQKLKKRLQSHQ